MRRSYSSLYSSRQKGPDVKVCLEKKLKKKKKTILFYHFEPVLVKIILQPCERRLISIKRERCFTVAVLPNLNTLAKFPFCFSGLTAFSLFSKINCLLALTNIYIRRLKQFPPLLFVGVFIYSRCVTLQSFPTIRQRGTF